MKEKIKNQKGFILILILITIIISVIVVSVLAIGIILYKQKNQELKVSVLEPTSEETQSEQEAQKIKEKEESIEKRYREVIQTYISELLEKKKELALSNDKERSKEIKNRINNLEKEMQEIRKERFNFTNVTNSRFSSLADDGSIKMANYVSGSIDPIGWNRCVSCGELFNPDISGIASALSTFCPKCKS